MNIRILRTGIIFSALTFSTNNFAINGSFDNAYSEITRGMGGSGAALAQDSIISAINPAGLVNVGDRFDAGAAFYFPDFEIKNSPGGGPLGALTMPNGSFKNQYKLIFLPDIGYAKQIDNKSAWGASLYAIGGFGTEYNTTENATVMTMMGAMPLPGLLGNGDVKTLLRIGVLNGTYSRKLYENEKVNIFGGVSVLGAFQTYSNSGSGTLGNPLLSASPANVSNKGTDYNFGLGVRIALQFELFDKATFAVSYQPKVNMTKFTKYKGLFANEGELDIPANGLIAFAYHLNKDLAFTFDIQHIWYHDVAAYGNSGECLTTMPMPSCKLGATTNAAGFGWKNQSAYKVGVQWNATENLTLRTGANFADLIVNKKQMLENALTPGVTVESILSAGATYKYKQNEINAFLVYIPSGSLEGTNNFSPAQNIEIKTTGVGVGLGYTRVFG